HASTRHARLVDRSVAKRRPEDTGLGGRPLRPFAGPATRSRRLRRPPGACYLLRTMERARKRLAKRKRPRAPRRPTRVATPRPTPAEKRLLGLSREIARLPLAAALGKLASAWA